MNQYDRSDADLVAGTVKGDPLAFSALMARYKGPLYRFILRYCGNSADAEDLLQDLFIKVYRKARAYDPRYPVSTWLYRIALNTCRDYSRRRRLRRWLALDRWQRDSADDGPPIDRIASSVDVESQAIARDELDELARVIEDLPHDLRSALVLAAVEERSHAECAEILGVTAKAVETRVRRARSMLRSRIASDT